MIYSSNIRGDANGNVYAYNNPNNAAILADPDKYIKPLQAKGIKVLLGYLGDHTGAGFANLTNQQAESFCNQIIEVGEAAGVDGYFLDDEWSEYGTRGWPPANSTSFSNVILNNYPAGLGKSQYAFTRSRSMYRPDAPRFIERLLPIFNVPGITLSSVQYRFKRPIK